jgi:hypothetical protein
MRKQRRNEDPRVGKNCRCMTPGVVKANRSRHYSPRAWGVGCLGASVVGLFHPFTRKGSYTVLRHKLGRQV